MLLLVFQIVGLVGLFDSNGGSRKNIWEPAWPQPLIIWEATMAKRNYYIEPIKNLGGLGKI